MESSLRAVVCIVLTAAILAGGRQVIMADDCDGNMDALLDKCLEFMKTDGPEESPSLACCDVVKHSDMGCFCKHMTQGMGDVISIAKAAFVARYCGQPLKPGSKCGDYTVPPSSNGKRAYKDLLF